MSVAVVYLVLSLGLLLLTLQLLFHRVYGSTIGAVIGGSLLVLANFTPHAIVLSGAVTAAAWSLGALAFAPGLVGLGVHVACWAAMLLHLQRVHRTLPILDGAPIGDGAPPLGASSVGPPPGLLRSWLALAFLRRGGRERVEVRHDLVYREVDGVRLRMDVYRPRTPGPHPVIVYFHGGGWVVGHRRTNRYMLTRLAAAGWVVFAAAYRRPPRFPLPAALVDCKAAIAWARAHAAEYGASARPLVVYGESAGGHLAALAALTQNLGELQPGFEAADTSVQGAMIFYGVTDILGSFERGDHPTLTLLLERAVVRRPLSTDRPLYQSLDPLTRAPAGVPPPTLAVQGTADMMVPPAMSRRFVERMRQLGAPAHLVEVPWASHAFDIFPSPLQERVLRVALGFLERLAPAGADTPPVG